MIDGARVSSLYQIDLGSELLDNIFASGTAMSGRWWWRSRGGIARTALLLIAAVGLLRGTRAVDVDCLQDPSATGCASFTVSDTALTAVLDQVCNSVGNNSGWPSACSLYHECLSGQGADAYCRPLGLVRAACKEQPDISSECKGYVNLCGLTSTVEQCTTDSILPDVPSAEDAMAATISMCRDMPGMDGCQTCNSSTPEGMVQAQSLQIQCPNPLASLARVCIGMWMTGCEAWDNFCVAADDNKAFPVLCGSSDTLPLSNVYDKSSMGEMAMDTGTDTTTSDSSCYNDPSKEECKTFEMTEEEIQSDLSNLCAAMPYMVGCSLWKQCNTSAAKGPYCHPFRLLGTICEDMPSMTGCKSYLDLCNPEDSVVEQCTAEQPVPSAPKTENAVSDILEMCGSHSMPACSECPSKFDCPHPMETLASLCLGMPGMSGCAEFYAMCSTDGEDGGGGSTFSGLCGSAAGGSSDSLPPMRMWIHSGIEDILLFKEWVPRTDAAYAGACIGVLFAAIFVQWLKALRIVVESSWATQRSVRCCGPGIGMCENADAVDVEGASDHSKSESDTRICSSCSAPPDERIKRRTWQWSSEVLSVFTSRSTFAAFVPRNRSQMFRNFVRGAFTFVIVLFDYALMLIVMSFNLGIIFSTVAGLAVGSVMFGHVGERKSNSSFMLGSTPGPDPENDLEVQFVDPSPCCNTGSSRHV